MLLEAEAFSELVGFSSREFLSFAVATSLEVQRTAAVVGLCCLGRTKQASPWWEAHPNPLSSCLPLVYGPFPTRCDLWDSHRSGGPSAACSKQGADLDFQPEEVMAVRQLCL